MKNKIIHSLFVLPFIIFTLMVFSFFYELFNNKIINMINVLDLVLEHIINKSNVIFLNNLIHNSQLFLSVIIGSIIIILFIIMLIFSVKGSKVIKNINNNALLNYSKVTMYSLIMIFILLVINNIFIFDYFSIFKFGVIVLIVNYLAIIILAILSILEYIKDNGVYKLELPKILEYFSKLVFVLIFIMFIILILKNITLSTIIGIMLSYIKLDPVIFENIINGIDFNVAISSFIPEYINSLLSAFKLDLNLSLTQLGISDIFIKGIINNFVVNNVNTYIQEMIHNVANGFIFKNIIFHIIGIIVSIIGIVVISIRSQIKDYAVYILMGINVILLVMFLIFIKINIFVGFLISILFINVAISIVILFINFNKSV